MDSASRIHCEDAERKQPTRFMACLLSVMLAAQLTNAQPRQFEEPTPPPLATWSRDLELARRATTGRPRTTASYNGANIASRGLVTPPWRNFLGDALIPVDLIFLIDGSGSVNYFGSGNFDRIKAWIKRVASAFDIANENVQIGVVQYSHRFRNLPLNQQMYIKTEVALGRCDDRSCFEGQVNRMKLMGYTTYTGAAISKTVGVDFAGSRRDANRIIVLLTDGSSRDDVAQASAYARSQNVTIFCVGVGNYHLSELQIIANGEINNSWRVYQLQRFSQLSTIVEDLQREIKAVYEIPVCTPLITPIHGTLSCSNSNEIGSVCRFACDEASGYTVQGSSTRICHNLPIIGPSWTGRSATCGVCSANFDLLIIMDSSSSIGFYNFLIMKDFVRRLIDTLEIGPSKVQVSLMRYNKAVFNLWEYNTYHNRNSLIQAVLDINYSGTGTRTGRALHYALDYKFSQQSGRRPGYPHITVILTDGKSSDSIVTPSERLHKISKVIAIGLRDADQRQIDQIASDPDERYSHNVIGNFADLLEIIREVADKLCGAQESVTNTTCPIASLPNPSTCHELSCTNSNQAGSVCHATCCDGYEIRNNLTAQCYYDGNWSQTNWACVETACPEIQMNRGVRKNCTDDANVGSFCSIACADGFEISGPITDGNCESSTSGEYLNCVHTCRRTTSVESAWEPPVISCIEIDECSSNPCMHNGTCHDDADGFACVCADGYEGPLCEVDINECVTNPCANGGACIDGQNSYSCVCHPGYSGDVCDVNINDCDPDPCVNGVCHDLTNGFSCVCRQGYTGTNCETYILQCGSNPCDNGGICSETVPGSYSCSCPVAYSGINCEIDIDECAPRPCSNSNYEACLNQEGDYYCVCRKGFYGRHCENVDECFSNPCLNGATCHNLSDGFECSCTPGYWGTTCGQEINECLSLPCYNNARCTNLVNGFSCVCEPGYSGIQCRIDIDDCASNPCLHGGNCTDLVNAFQCQCQPGYSGDTCETDINECESDPCNNGAACINKVNGFKCVCPVGFTGDTCETDINECLPESCINGGTCYNLVSGYYCECPNGYEGTHCQDDINECDSNPCVNALECRDGIASYFCECQSGYEGFRCERETDHCSPNPCLNDGECVNVEANFTCNCRHDYTGSRCETLLDHCRSLPCFNNGTCTSSSTGYSCACVAGYSGDDCRVDIDECLSQPCANSETCTDGINTYSCSCPDGFGGTDCEVDVNECNLLDEPCSDHGECIDLVNDYRCKCNGGYYGEVCQFETDECQPSPCQYGGTCEDRIASYQCNCMEGYSGVNCEDDIDECTPNPCLHDSLCIDGINSYECQCPDGWRGMQCADNVNECLNDPCMNGRFCADLPGSYLCNCAPGFSGQNCEIDNRPCATDPCGNNGNCVDKPNDYMCDCPGGFSGRNCLQEINECDMSPCSNGGNCTDLVNDFRCDCPTGFTGPTCEIIYCEESMCGVGGIYTAAYGCLCLPGYTGPTCDEDIDDCVNNSVCVNGHCVDQLNSFFCRCNDGYTGDLCDTNVNECLVNPCQNDAECIDEVGSYYCQCPEEYTGRNCQILLDQCSLNPCVNGGSCTNTDGTYLCTCPSGFEGRNCERNIDCDSNPCSNGSSGCRDDVNGFVCDCLPGFTGTTCSTNIDDCDPDPCYPGGDCLDGTSDFACICYLGYSGIRCNNIVDYCLIGMAQKCQNGGTCVHNSSGYTCACPLGYGGDACENEIRCDFGNRSGESDHLSNCVGEGQPGTRCTLRCPSGKLPRLWRGVRVSDAPPVRTCLRTGTWSIADADWVCQAILCPMLTAENLTQHNVPVDKIRSFTLGNRSININTTISSTQTSSSSTVVLRSNAINDSLHYVSCTNDNKVGSVCTFGCSSGYQPSGSTTRTCLHNGEWSGTESTCDQTSCPSPVVHDNDIYVCLNEFQVGSLCYASCPAGHMLNVIHFKICINNFQWYPDSRPWVCIPTHCAGPPPTTFNGEYECTSSTLRGSVCKSRCDIGFKEMSPGRYTCTDADNTLSWRGNAGDCVRMQCDKSIDLETGVVTGFDSNDDYAILQKPPYYRSTPGSAFLLGPPRCNLKAVVAINDTLLSSVSLDLWYGNLPYNYHIDIGDQLANGLQGLENVNAVRDEITGYNNRLMTYSYMNSVLMNGTDAMTTTGFSGNGFYPGIFKRRSHITINIRDSYVDFGNNKSIRGTIGPSPNFSARNGHSVLVGLNRLSNTNPWLDYHRLGSGLCYVCINREA